MDTAYGILFTASKHFRQISIITTATRCRPTSVVGIVIADGCTIVCETIATWITSWHYVGYGGWSWRRSRIDSEDAGSAGKGEGRTKAGAGSGLRAHSLMSRNNNNYDSKLLRRVRQRGGGRCNQSQGMQVVYACQVLQCQLSEEPLA